jgi:NADPH:quinone reductase-like Zn-dependent oxidoreductase
LFLRFYRSSRRRIFCSQKRKGENIEENQNKKMKAMQISYKTAKAKQVEIDRPTILPHQVLVNVHFAAIDTALHDVLNKRMSGMFVHAKARKSEPLILGWHYSGMIVEKGTDVKDVFQLQDMVWGFLQYEPSQTQGSFAEYIAVGIDECALVPEGIIDLKELTASSTEAITALQAIRDLGRLNVGTEKKSILVLGAGGGVGSAAVQIAKIIGAHVTASCSTKDIERVKVFGADNVIDRRRKDPLEPEAKYDIVFDASGKYSATRCMRKLSPNGAYVVTLPSVGLFVAMFLSLFNKKSAKFIACQSKRSDLDLMGTWIKQGRLEIDVDSVFPIHEIEKAIARQNSSLKVGRVVIQVKDGWKS